ncbi:MAG: alpha/beta fold hydrolase [Limnobacter sp.]|nr:alpha/beta fold hydrolase [Limnobacter sp.]
MKPELLLTPPAKSTAALEARVALDLIRMGSPLFQSYRQKEKVSRKQKVVVVPGFGAGDGYTWPLRQYLANRGFDIQGWGLGVNKAGLDIAHQLSDLHPRWKFEPRGVYRREGGVPLVTDRLIERLEALGQRDNKPIALIGWSLGGYMAREAARELPHLISQVVTLGTPVIGGPKYTLAAPAFIKRKCDLDWIEQSIAFREEKPIQVPVTALVSPSDGVVGYNAALDHHSPNVQHINMDVSHLAFPYSPKAWKVIERSLMKQEA